MKSFRFILTTFLILFLLTGCSNSQENLENYYYAMAIGVDSSEDGNGIIFNVQIATNSEESSSQEGSSQSSSSHIYSIPCSTIDSGISILNNYLSKKINFSHCNAIIFSEELSKQGIKQYIYSLGNNSEIRPTCNVLISSKTSLDALERISNSSENFSSKFYEFLKNSTRFTGYSIVPELSEIFYSMNLDADSSIATYASVSDDTIQNTGIAIFKDGKFIKNLSVLDSISFSLLTNRLEYATISVPNPNNPIQLIDVRITQIKSPKTICHLINHYPYITQKLVLEYDVLSSPENLENSELEKIINLYIENMISSFLYEISHKYDVDICNFKNKMMEKYWTYEEFEKVHWDKIYKDSYFHVEIIGKIENYGVFSKEEK